MDPIELPKWLPKELLKDDKKSEDQCIVCYENKDVIIILPCCHYICDHCSNQWFILGDNKKCPTCNNIILDQFIKEKITPIVQINEEFNDINDITLKFDDVILNHSLSLKIKELLYRYYCLLRNIDESPVDKVLLPTDVIYKLGETFKKGMSFIGKDEKKAIFYLKLAEQKNCAKAS